MLKIVISKFHPILHLINQAPFMFKAVLMRENAYEITPETVF